MTPLRLVAFAVLASLSTTAVAQDDAPPPPTPLNSDWMEAFSWRCIGPANMGGRTIDLAVYEADPSTWYAATASGGLLKTTNRGVTFEHLFDDQETVALGAVAVAADDPDLVWVGTGEYSPRNSTSYGDGVYKSTDGGETWTNMGLSETFQTGDIVIHPGNSDVVYVGALGRLYGPNEDRGLYKTTDGGATWKKVLYIDDRTGIIDIAMHPTDPDTLLVAAYDRERDGFDTNSPSRRYGDGAGIYRTRDGGETFERLTQGLPSVKMGRIGLDYYRKNPDRIYAIVESEWIGKAPESMPHTGFTGEDADAGVRVTEVDEDGAAATAGLKVDDIILAVGDTMVLSNEEFQTMLQEHVAGDELALRVSRDREVQDLTMTLAKRPEGARSPFAGSLNGQRENLQDRQQPDGHEYGGVYRSDDGGTSWTRINSVNPRPMYFSTIAVDPVDDQNIYLCGISMYRSKDGGETFTSDAGRGVHSDQHALWVDPADPRHIICGSDGGLYITYDRCDRWDHLNHMAMGQFYHVGVGPRRDYMVYGGLQDNGSWGGPSRARSGSGILNEHWMSVGGGDGFICLVDPNDPDLVYYESQNGATGRRNMRTGQGGRISPVRERGAPRYRFNWKTPFILSHHNSRIYYSAGNHVFRSLDRGQDHRPISPEITRGERGSATALSESAINPGVLYVGTDDGALWGTQDGGHTWSNLWVIAERESIIATVEATPPTPIANDIAGATRVRGGPWVSPADLVPVERDDVISGAWEAELISELIPEGEGKFTMTLKMSESGKITGSLESDMGPSDVIGGKYNADTGTLSITTRSDNGEATMSGKLKDGAWAGTLSVMDGEFELDFVARRSKAETGDAEGEAAAPAATQAAASAPPAAAPATSAEVTEVPPGNSDDVISGEWAVQLISEFIPEGQGKLTMTLKMSESGAITGSLESERGPSDVTGGKYNADTGALSITTRSENGEASMSGKLTDGAWDGTFIVGAGDFEMDFSARRTKAAVPAVTQEAASDAPAATEPEAPAVIAEGRPMAELVPGPRWVSSLEASKFAEGRVYVTLDAHRSNDDNPYVLKSEDFGATWTSLSRDLPRGSTRVIREDLENENVLYLGTEFKGYVSIDRGQTWTSMNSNLPTVAIHELAQHGISGELVAGTHGRSIWITDVTALRQITPETVAAAAHLYEPNDVVLWRPGNRVGSTGSRRFVGESPERGAAMYYSLAAETEDIQLRVTDLSGRVLRELDAPGTAGLHKVTWDLRAVSSAQPQQQQRGGRFGRRGRTASAGTYRVTLAVGGEEQSHDFKLLLDPNFPEDAISAEQGLWEGEDWSWELHHEKVEDDR